MRLTSLLSTLFCASSTVLAALPFQGADWSSLLIEEAAGKKYKNSAGTVQPLETIFKASGVNTVRSASASGSIPPTATTTSTTEYNLRLAKRAKAAGLNIYLDFHYSDNWADPSKQATPAAWQSLSQEALLKQVYDYTKSTLDAFQQNGLALSLVSLGNEITSGMLFPMGKLHSNEKPAAAHLAALLHSASQGVQASSLRPRPKIMLHLDNGWNWATQQWWYSLLLESGGGLSLADFDIQAVSYYPFYNSAATLGAPGTSLANLASQYGKEVMVVETNWPSWCPNPKYAFPADTRSIPVSVEGQVMWMEEVAKRVAAVPGGKGTGLFYWEPAWIDNAGLGSSCGWNLMFGDDGKVMSSLAVFGSI